ncbi:hypothetical protein AB4851_09450 [Burkholderia sp. 22PA0099]
MIVGLSVGHKKFVRERLCADLAGLASGGAWRPPLAGYQRAGGAGVLPGS